MGRALELAAGGVALTSPNPMVGAVLVRKGKIVGEGFHLYDGVRHAEIVALEEAGDAARGATLYINLEPCCHKGRTGPCTNALILADVKRVVVAMKDPNPAVAGRGFKHLRAAGIEVSTGLREAEARRLAESFAKWIVNRQPLVTLKSALTLDGQLVLPHTRGRARSRLKDNGVLSLSFAVINDALGTKIYRMMQEAFDGKGPICIYAGDGSVIYVQSKKGDLTVPAKLLADSEFEDRSAFYHGSTIPIDVSTDDWPFFYMPHRVYPVSYLPMLGLVVFLSLLLYQRFFSEKPRGSHVPFFFLGAGFMLVETKAITELGLTFGNTWRVIAIAIAGILTMSYLSNSFVQRLRFRNSFWPHLLVLASLLAGWWIAKTGGLPSTSLGRLGTAFLLTCPVFFSGIVFSSLLVKETNISSVMAVNLLGAMFGGILEYNSMYFGFHFLYLLAVGLYATSFVLTFVQRAPAVIPAPSE